MPRPEPAESDWCRVPARAALAGNPSDGYGGAVVAVPVPALAARARFIPGATSDDAEIVGATRTVFERAFGLRAEGALQWTTTIPYQVGLAGSSAIVIACLRALAASHAVAIERLALARLALQVETQEMGIAAGLQDRITQAFGLPMFMDFAATRFVALAPPAMPPLFVVHAAIGERSQTVHNPLRARWERGDAAVTQAVNHLRALAHDARLGLEAGDPDRLGRAMTESTLARFRLYEPAPEHRALFELARQSGIPANFAGSGGAIVCIGPPDADLSGRRLSDFAARGLGVVRV